MAQRGGLAVISGVQSAGKSRDQFLQERQGDLLAGWFPRGFTSSTQVSSGGFFVFGTEGGRVLAENPKRKRWLVENRDAAAVVYVCPTNELNITKALQIQPGQSFIDNPPWVHWHEVFAFSTVAGSVIVVHEWSQVSVPA